MSVRRMVISISDNSLLSHNKYCHHGIQSTNLIQPHPIEELVGDAVLRLANYLRSNEWTVRDDLEVAYP